MHVPEYLSYADLVSWPCSNHLTFFPKWKLKVIILHSFVDAAEVTFNCVNLKRHIKQPLLMLILLNQLIKLCSVYEFVHVIRVLVRPSLITRVTNS